MRNPLKIFRSLRHESLESRRLLATDLGQIAGVVTNDLDGDFIGDIAAPGVDAQLFRDDGDGSFDPAGSGGGDTQEGVTVMTDSAGAYSFDSLTAGNYFVLLTPPAGQTSQFLSSLIEITPTEAMGTTNITIDDFTAAQTVSATRAAGAVGPVSASGFASDGSITGNERDVFVEVTDGVGDIEVETGFNNGSAIVLKLGSDSGVNGRAVATYDGTDGADTIDHTNLSLDLLDGGNNSAFALNIAADQADGDLILRAFSGAGNFSVATIPLTSVDTDGTIDGDAAEAISIAFSDFVDDPGGGANFSSITALQLELDFTGAGENGLDAEVEVLGVVGFSTETVPEHVVQNELSLGDQVWIDLDNDGMFMPGAGDFGVEGVALTLYQDTDNDDDYTDETAIDAAITDTNGNYLFTGRTPGDYIVQVDASNFLFGGPLFGLASSTGNDVMGMAPDPDNDENDKDNGTPQGDGSVVSKAITLTGDGEPTNDGDSDDDTNLTVDFGFFGYDLIINKFVNTAIASPNDTLVYDIFVQNFGPSTATGVEFSDTLPAGVTFVSGLTTVGGQTVNGAPGSSLVTSTIGMLAANQSATITIFATVDPTTSGDITNTASVSAPDDSNPDNNDSSATTTVSPVIDVLIRKSDDDNDQTLSPGDGISYTLEVENSGPSTATGVTVTDLLPTGLTFNPTGSTPPTSTTPVTGGTQLTYGLGTIAAGAPVTTITINADIDSNFTGSLTNTASVAANETETTTANNTATASSTVAVEPATLSGFVYVDANNNGVRDAGEAPIPNVPVTLMRTDAGGPMTVLATTTDSSGFYSFTNLDPGTYKVTETQPAFFVDGQESSPTGATQTNDEISAITLGAGDNATANNFGELGPALTKRRFLASFVLAQIGDETA